MKPINLTALTLTGTLALSGCVATVPVTSPRPLPVPQPVEQRAPHLHHSFTTGAGDFLTVTSQNGAKKAGKVTICLRNGTGNRKWKGMHWKSVKPKKARYVADGSGTISCGTHPAKGMKAWYLYKSHFVGIKKPAGQYFINQGDHADRTIVITWVND